MLYLFKKVILAALVAGISFLKKEQRLEIGLSKPGLRVKPDL